jgi:hypothetical protein
MNSIASITKVLYGVEKYDKFGRFEGYMKNVVFDPQPVIAIYNEIDGCEENEIS